MLSQLKKKKGKENVPRDNKQKVVLMLFSRDPKGQCGPVKLGHLAPCIAHCGLSEKILERPHCRTGFRVGDWGRIPESGAFALDWMM